jgi:hypothetical protein
LKELELVDSQVGSTLLSLLSLAAKEGADTRAIAAYKALGPPTFLDISGTVDLRCRFHHTLDEFHAYKDPADVVGLIPTVSVALRVVEPGQEEKRIVFQMDDEGVVRMCRFLEATTKQLARAKILQSKLMEVSKP